jgi:uncharacterized protein with von Willebrand factor type A (vWA) domain
LPKRNFKLLNTKQGFFHLRKEFQDKRQKEKEEAKGPFIICVDTSGSMHGTPETVAKTLCFAILKIAIKRKQKMFSHFIQHRN